MHVTHYLAICVLQLLLCVIMKNDIRISGIVFPQLLIGNLYDSINDKTQKFAYQEIWNLNIVIFKETKSKFVSIA